MREIKFRAWDRQTKLWYGRLGKPFSLQDAMVAEWFTPYSQLEVMQYTGLKDKNGVEIYEGDIVAIDSPENKDRMINEIKYFPEWMGFMSTPDGGVSIQKFAGQTRCKLGKQWRDHIRANNYECHMVEVIGNIYQNPELIGEGSNE